MEKLLFIVPPNITYDAFTNPPKNVKIIDNGRKKLGALVTDMPLGPLSLSAYLKKHLNIQVQLLDFNIVINRINDRFDYLNFKSLFREILEKIEPPDFVAISCLFSPAYQSMLDLAACSRDLFPKSWILGGGFLPTNMYKQIYSDSDAFHALCIGEGEKPLLRFIQSINRSSFLQKDENWITKDKAFSKSSINGTGVSIITLKGEKMPDYSLDLIENLDEIPFLDYEIADLPGYRINPTINAYPALRKPGKQAFHIMTSRGCIFKCSFCAQDTVHGRSMRYHSLDRINADLLELRQRYQVQTVVIEDDHFMANPERAANILDLLIKHEITACFPNALALYALKRPMLEKLKAVGVDQLVLAVESGSNHVLNKIMHKPLRLHTISQVTHDCRSIGIYTDCNIVIGQPGEKLEHFEETRSFLRTTQANWFRINVATPITGSELLTRAIDTNSLKGEFTHCDYKKAIIETKDFSANGLQNIAYLLNLELNFVHNTDYHLGNYETALIGFENALRAKPDHYFALYMAAQCHRQLGNLSKEEELQAQALKSRENPDWQFWIQQIDQPLSNIIHS